MSDTSRAPYPPEWPMISVLIRARSGLRCECTSECGLHRSTPGPRRCIERDGDLAVFARGKVMLTVAHLDSTIGDDGFLDCHPDNLVAMCQRCHLRFDVPLHRRNASLRRERESGQIRLFERES